MSRICPRSLAPDHSSKVVVSTAAPGKFPGRDPTVCPAEKSLVSRRRKGVIPSRKPARRLFPTDSQATRLIRLSRCEEMGFTP